MDNPTILLPSTPRFLSKDHTRAASRSPTRPRLMDDVLADLSPATTLEAFTSASGTLKASIEAATPTQRAFGIRAAIASKKIQEWMAELSDWPWPTGNSEGFELPNPKRRKITNEDINNQQTEQPHGSRQDIGILHKEEFWGSLPAAEVRRYESRIEEISEDMEELNVEEIKSQILDRHVLPRSRASSLSGPYKEPPASLTYTEIDDFTAIVTATVLQALPSLSRLMALMDMWSVRLSVLREIPRLMASMDDAEIALKSGWNAIHVLEPKSVSEHSSSRSPPLSRQDYEIMRDVLKIKVSKLGQNLDNMLDTLEGRDDTLPEAWLDRMESIEQNYGEWVVYGERKVSEDEWAKENATRRLEQLRSLSPAVVEPQLGGRKGDPIPKLEDELVTKAAPAMVSQIAGPLETEDDMPNEAPIPKLEDELVTKVAPALVSQIESPLETEDNMPNEAPSSNLALHDMALMEAPPKDSELSQIDGHRDGNLPRQETEGVSVSEENMLQPMESAKLTENSRDHVKGELPSLKMEPAPPLLGKNNAPTSQDETIIDLPSVSDNLFEEAESSKLLTKSTDLPQSALDVQDEIWTREENEVGPSYAENMKPMTPSAARQILIAESFPKNGRKPFAPPESSPSWQSGPSRSAVPSTDEHRHEISRQSSNSPRIPNFSHHIANSLRIETPPRISAGSSPMDISDSNYSSPKFTATAAVDLSGHPAVNMPRTSQEKATEESKAQVYSSDAVAPPKDIPVTNQSESIQRSALNLKPTYIDLPKSDPIINLEKSLIDHLSPDIKSPESTKGHTREPSSASIISGYATSEPSPVIHEAEPTEYFRPVSPPIIAELSDLPSITTPTRISFSSTPVSAKASETVAKWELETLSNQRSSQPEKMSPDSPRKVNPIRDKRESELSGTPPRRRPISNDSIVSVIRNTPGHGRTSQDGSVGSEISTINERLNSTVSTPTRIESPAMETVPRSWHSQFVSDYDGDSPSLGRVRSLDTNSPASSPPETPPSARGPLQLRKTPSFDPDSFYSDSPATPGEPPALNNVELSPTPALSSPSKHSDDQLQQQISEILESIPARIKLTSEPSKTEMSSLKPVKKRISLNPFSRPASRASTPSFTLAPADARNPRPRPHNGNPEIKLYHLSRSTGEAPIKLLVRLVGENGERVMVRVGGGWADLGEYLKEYASHHGRRSDKPGKVEIQDVQPRVVSTGSTVSTSTLRNGTWNTSAASSPASRAGSRPGSALGRPLSSLAIRKTRKSVGEEAREKSYRSPSTPLPLSFRSSPSGGRLNETPPSANSARSVSQMAWREEESSLGLAGPRSRKGEVSAENAAWVESMKEKVRIASAEKEKKEKAAFGNMGQVGATKRLFKRTG